MEFCNISPNNSTDLEISEPKVLAENVVYSREVLDFKVPPNCSICDSISLRDLDFVPYYNNISFKSSDVKKTIYLEI